MTKALFAHLPDCAEQSQGTQENVNQYDSSFGTLFGHYLSRQGGVVELPLSNVDTGIQAGLFPQFGEAAAALPPGASREFRSIYTYDQGRLRAGQVSLELSGTLARDPTGAVLFRGAVRGVEQFYNFERRVPGERTPFNEVLTTIGRSLPGVPFLIRYVGDRPAYYPRRRRRKTPR